MGKPLVTRERAFSCSVANTSLPAIVPVTQLHYFRTMIAILGRRLRVIASEEYRGKASPYECLLPLRQHTPQTGATPDSIAKGSASIPGWPSSGIWYSFSTFSVSLIQRVYKIKHFLKPSRRFVPCILLDWRQNKLIPAEKNGCFRPQLTSFAWKILHMITELMSNS